MIREFEYVCLLVEQFETHITMFNNIMQWYMVDSDKYYSSADLHIENTTMPLCTEIKPGVVSLSSSKGVWYKVTGDMFFKRMGDAPFFFTVNINPYDMTPRPGGVCSLKVDWSC